MVDSVAIYGEYAGPLKKLSLNTLCHLIEGAEEIRIDFPFTGLENGISI